MHWPVSCSLIVAHHASRRRQAPGLAGRPRSGHAGGGPRHHHLRRPGARAGARGPRTRGGGSRRRRLPRPRPGDTTRGHGPHLDMSPTGAPVLLHPRLAPRQYHVGREPGHGSIRSPLLSANTVTAGPAAVGMVGPAQVAGVPHTGDRGPRHAPFPAAMSRPHRMARAAQPRHGPPPVLEPPREVYLHLHSNFAGNTLATFSSAKHLATGPNLQRPGDFTHDRTGRAYPICQATAHHGKAGLFASLLIASGTDVKTVRQGCGMPAPRPRSTPMATCGPTGMSPTRAAVDAVLQDRADYLRTAAGER